MYTFTMYKNYICNIPSSISTIFPLLNPLFTRSAESQRWHGAGRGPNAPGGAVAGAMEKALA